MTPNPTLNESVPGPVLEQGGLGPPGTLNADTCAATPKSAATEARVIRGIERIGEALATYAKASGTRLADLDDFICDLLHYADQGGVDVEALLRNARTNWMDER